MTEEELLEKARVLREAVEATQRARDAIVEAARHQAALPSVVASNRDEESLTDDAWNDRLRRAERVDYEVRLLIEAERAEADARASLGSDGWAKIAQKIVANEAKE